MPGWDAVFRAEPAEHYDTTTRSRQPPLQPLLIIDHATDARLWVQEPDYPECPEKALRKDGPTKPRTTSIEMLGSGRWIIGDYMRENTGKYMPLTIIHKVYNNTVQLRELYSLTYSRIAG